MMQSSKIIASLFWPGLGWPGLQNAHNAHNALTNKLLEVPRS